MILKYCNCEGTALDIQVFHLRFLYTVDDHDITNMLSAELLTMGTP